MPQLDTTTYSSQLFWLVICFVALYCILAYFLVPKISRIIEKRDAIREHNINTASTYREEAEGLLADYERLLEQTRREAHDKYQAVVNLTVHEMTEKKKQMVARLQERLHVAEQDLYRARTEASQEMHAVAQEIAGDILKKLTGQTYSSTKLTIKKDKA